MSIRLGALALLLTAASAVVACQSSGPYTTPATVAANVGLGLAGAAASRAAGGCFAQCLPGTVCNKTTGLCERPEFRPTAKSPTHVALSATASYPPGHESDIPASGAPDAGCDPADAGEHGLSCEMDGGATY